MSILLIREPSNFKDYHRLVGKDLMMAELTNRELNRLLKVSGMISRAKENSSK